MLALAICLVPAAISWIGAMTGPRNIGVGVATVEWVRQHGGNPLVSEVENIYYTLNAPSKGGPALKSLPQVGVANVSNPSRPKRRADPYRPPPIEPLIHPALKGEGEWHAASATAGREPPVLLTTFRSDPEYPQFVAGVAWIDSRRTHLEYVPGLAEPPEIEDRGPAEVPLSMRGQLAATFNGGFPLETSNAGLVYHGLHVLGAGAVLAGMVLGAIAAFAIDRKFLWAGGYAMFGAALALVGLIHGDKVQFFGDGHIALGYAFFGLVFIGAHFLGAPVREVDPADPIDVELASPPLAADVFPHEPVPAGAAVSTA